jgi:hypothetical protein
MFNHLIRLIRIIVLNPINIFRIVKCLPKRLKKEKLNILLFKVVLVEFFLEILPKNSILEDELNFIIFIICLLSIFKALLPNS